MPTPRLRAQFDAAGGKPAYVRQMFGHIARVYDLMNRLMTAGLDGRWRSFAARQITLGPHQRALDIGTGTGDLAIAVARASDSTARVVGVDFTPEMLEHARSKVAHLGLADQIEFLSGDGEHLEFADASFDACGSAWVVRNLADLSRGLSEMLRVVKPGGRMVCLEMSHPSHPVLATGFHLYFNYAIPLLGRLVGRAVDAYRYLPTSTSSFPAAPELARILEDVGWQDVRYYYRLGGVVAVHVATKPVL
jgi:demethylmenaquinone methyltransferase/2-methoxy-6-polyprenyl-1,4-benzoquinol methylase